MNTKIIELDFILSNQLSYTTDSFYCQARYDTLVFSAMIKDDVVATFAVVAYKETNYWALPYDFKPQYDSPFFNWDIFPKCPKNYELFVLRMFLEVFFDQYPQYDILYAHFENEEMKQALAKIGFKYYENNFMFYQKKQSSN